MRRPDPESLRPPLALALLVAGILLAVSLARWNAGARPRFPLEHSNVAYSLASGLGYANPFGILSGPTAWVPPGVPLAFAAAIELSRATGMDERVPIVALNALAAAASVFLVLSFCMPRWTSGSRLVFCAAFLGYGLLDPDFLVSTGPLTAAASALLLAGLCAAAGNPGGWVPWVLLFAANGLLAVTHPGLALAGGVASVAVGMTGLRTEPGKSAGILMSAGFAALAGIAATAGPWTIRNHRVFHQWIPAKSNGYFELVLSHDETDDGVLTESALVVGHPSTNPRLLADYARLGERDFLLPYPRAARRILTADPGRYATFCLDRLFNAICFSQSPADMDPVTVGLPSALAARLVGRRLVLQCVGTSGYFWARSVLPPEAERAALAAAGVAPPGALLADWARAQGDLKERTARPTSILTRFLWSGFPTLCFLAAFGAARLRPPRLVLAAGAVYLIALLPNVLITHDLRHQSSFMLLFALFSAGAAEAVRLRPLMAPGDPAP